MIIVYFVAFAVYLLCFKNPLFCLMYYFTYNTQRNVCPTFMLLSKGLSQTPVTKHTLQPPCNQALSAEGPPVGMRPERTGRRCPFNPTRISSYFFNALHPCCFVMICIVAVNLQHVCFVLQSELNLLPWDWTFCSTMKSCSWYWKPFCPWAIARPLFVCKSNFKGLEFEKGEYWSLINV